MLIYNVGFVNEDNEYDAIRLNINADNLEDVDEIEFINLILDIKDEIGVKKITDIDYIGYKEEFEED